MISNHVWKSALVYHKSTGSETGSSTGRRVVTEVSRSEHRRDAGRLGAGRLRERPAGSGLIEKRI